MEKALHLSDQAGRRGSAEAKRSHGSGTGKAFLLGNIRQMVGGHNPCKGCSPKFPRLEFMPISTASELFTYSITGR